MAQGQGSDQEHQVAMVQEWPRGATPHLRSGAVAERSSPRPRSGAAVERSYPTSKEQRLHGRRNAERSYSTFKVRRGNLVQSKEQWLCFAAAAVKRYPTSKVRETQVRW